MVYKKSVYPSQPMGTGAKAPESYSPQPAVKKEDLKRTDGKDFDEADSTIFRLLNECQNTLREVAIMHELAKNHYHAKGLQGFKRLSRYWAREYYEASMCIQSAMIDYYHIMPVIDVDVARDYSEKSIEELIYHTHDRLEMLEERLSPMINELVLLPDSFAASKLKEVLEMVRCEHKYADRHKHYCMDVEWNMADLHLYSSDLHEKYKCLEEEKHNRKFES